MASGRCSSAKASTFSASSGPCGGPKWTSEMWRRWGTVSDCAPRCAASVAAAGAVFFAQIRDGVAELCRDVAGERRHHATALLAPDPKAGSGRQRHRHARAATHQVAPVEALRQQLVEEVFSEA